MEPKYLNALVVDDSAEAAAAVSRALEAEGLSTKVAKDGKEALAAMAAAPADLVVLDLELPDLDGLEVLKSLRPDEGPRYLPVLAVSAKDEKETRLAALKLGAEDYLAKPWDPEELALRLHRLVRLKKRMEGLAMECEQAQKLSATDPLTHLTNHRYFRDRLRDEFRRASRYDDPVSLVLMDIDQFAGLNEKHGASVGDQVVKDVARLLKKTVRDTDLLSRYSGGGFAMVLPKTHVAGALTVAERVWRELGTLGLGPAKNLSATASFGLAAYPTRRAVLSADQLFHAAEDALRTAKADGGNRIALFQKEAYFGPVPGRNRK